MKKIFTRWGVASLFSLMALSMSAQIQLVKPTVSDDGTTFTVTLSLTDQNGISLDAAKLFFCVYVDSDNSPVTIDKATWAYIHEDMVEIPYGYTDTQYYDIWSNDGTTSFYYYWSGFKRLGAQAIYHDGDTTYKSEIAWTADDDGSGEQGGSGNEGDTPVYDESQLITNPSGQKVETVRTSTVFYRLGSTVTYTGDDTGVMTNYMKGADGNLYLLCVTGGNSTLNYLKLDYKGDNRYTAKMPQLVMIEEYDGVKYGFYASRMVKEVIDEKPDSISYIISKTVPNELDFTLEDDGTLTMDDSNNDVILGLTYSDGFWTGFGDKHVCDAPAAPLQNKLPEGATTQKWAMDYQCSTEHPHASGWLHRGCLRDHVQILASGHPIHRG
jgi:hypothetical protein